MKLLAPVLLAAALAGTAAAHAAAAAPSAPVRLRCMHLRNPLAINPARPILSWQLPWKGYNQLQEAYQIVAAASRNGLAARKGLLWNSGKIKGSDSVAVRYAGAPLRSGEKVYWKVRAWEHGTASPWSKPALFREGLRGRAAWHGAKWIGFAPTSPSGIQTPLPALYLRHAFAVRGAIRSATVYMCGIGLSRLYINGRRVSRDQLAPALTWYPKRCDYLAFDVTKLLKEGRNATGVVLGNGRMYGMPASYTIHKPPRLIFCLKIHYANGSKSTIVSTARWHITDGGPIRYDNEYNGETYDARKRMPGWNRPGFSSTGWKRAVVIGPPQATDLWLNVTRMVRRMVHGNSLNLTVSNATFGKDPAFNHVKRLMITFVANGKRQTLSIPENQPLALHGARLRVVRAFYGAGASPLQPPPAPILSAQPEPPIRIVQTIHPVGVVAAGAGKWIFDMGQNMVGWCRVHAAGPAGTTITLRHAESLLPNGHLYTANLRQARATDTLIFNGKPITWHPVFTYHGFRYVEVAGYPGKPSLSDLVGQEVHDPMRVTGGFACSDKLVNQIVHNCFWGIQDNYRSVPTDCPQRDERQGWMGDRARETYGEMFFFNNQAFYAKWLDDIQDAQLPSGSLSDVNPPYWSVYSNNVTWPSTFIFLPGSIYRQYGNLSVIRKHYAAMQRWMRLMEASVSHGVTARDTYGDWCSPPRSKHSIHSRDPNRATPGNVLATTTFCLDAKWMAFYAGLLHRPADQRHYMALARRLTSGLNAHCWNAKAGYYGNGSDTACLLPIAAGMVPHSRMQRVVKRLKFRINQRQAGHTGCGAVGVQCQDEALSEAGLGNLAWSMLNKTTYPSFGYEIRHHATTVWELWNGNTANPAMNSQNHVMLIGDTITWLFQYVGGIAPERAHPGYRRIRMQPHLMPGLTFVNAWHDSPYGKITSDWKLAHGRFTWHVTVPPNSRAMLYPPAGARDVSLRPRSKQPRSRVLSVTSGRYTVTAKLP